MLKHLPDILDKEDFESVSQRDICIEMYYMADRKGVVRATQDDIAEVCRLSRVSVSKHITRLCELGLLTWVRRGRYAIPVRAKSEAPMPTVADADAELERLQAIRQPHQGIFYRDDGWPVLGDRD